MASASSGVAGRHSSVRGERLLTTDLPVPDQTVLDDGLLHVLHLGAIGLVVAHEEGLQRGGDLLAVEITLLVGLHLRRTIPEAHREPGVLVGAVLEQPAPTQPLELAALGGHGGAVGLLELVPGAGPELAPRDPHDHGSPSSLRFAAVKDSHGDDTGGGDAPLSPYCFARRAAILSAKLIWLSSCGS